MNILLVFITLFFFIKYYYPIRANVIVETKVSLYTVLFRNPIGGIPLFFCSQSKKVTAAHSVKQHMLISHKITKSLFHSSKNTHSEKNPKL